MSAFKVIDLDDEGINVKSTPLSDAPSNPTTDSIPTPPKRGRGRPKGSTNASKLLPVGEIEEGITQFLSLLGMGVSFVNSYDGSVIIKQANPVAKSIAGMAAKDKKIHAQLTKALRAGSYAAVATATVPIAFAIGANHGFLPDMFLMDTGVAPTIQTRDTQFGEDVNMDADDDDSVGSPFVTHSSPDGNDSGLSGDAFSTVMNGINFVTDE